MTVILHETSEVILIQYLIIPTAAKLKIVHSTRNKNK